MSLLFSKKMPQKFNVSDGGNSFTLGRKVFFNKSYQSHESQNLANNNSSLNKPKPLPNNSSDLRIQRLRLVTIGSSSSKLKNINDTISFKTSNDFNNITNSLTKARGFSSSSVPKKNSITSNKSN